MGGTLTSAYRYHRPSHRILIWAEPGGAAREDVLQELTNRLVMSVESRMDPQREVLALVHAQIDALDIMRGRW